MKKVLIEPGGFQASTGAFEQLSRSKIYPVSEEKNFIWSRQAGAPLNPCKASSGFTPGKPWLIRNHAAFLSSNRATCSSPTHHSTFSCESGPGPSPSEPLPSDHLQASRDTALLSPTERRLPLDQREHSAASAELLCLTLPSQQCDFGVKFEVSEVNTPLA